jgi:DNA modification methylase
MDRAGELQEKWRVNRGDLFAIGDHRLLCGDSTDAGDVARLMGGEKIRFVFADPPYGIDLDTDYSKIKGTVKSPDAKGYTYSPVTGDTDDFAFERFAWIDCNEQFWWGADYYANKLPSGGSWFVWEKRTEGDAEMIGNDFELCWSKSRHKKRIIRRRWVGYVATEQGEKRTHPTQKPVDLCDYIISAFCDPEGMVFDPFLGSAPTMVAAEQTGRRCYGIEIEPKYCAVILERMSGMGLTPRLVARDGTTDETDA